MVAHLEQKPTPPIEINPSLPSDLNEIIMTAIQKDPGDRFQTAQAFRMALESIRPTLGDIAPAPLPAAAPASRMFTQPPPASIPTAPQQPAVASGPPPAPNVNAAPPPPPPPPPAAAKGHRGLWIGLGGLIVVAVLAVAALQLPRFLGTQASSQLSFGGDEPAQEAVTEAAEAPAVGESAAVPAQESAQAAPSAPAETAAVPEAAPARVQEPVASSPARRQAVSAPAQSPVPAAAAVPPSPAASEPAASAPPAAPAAPKEPAIDKAALAEARQRLRNISSRASAASRTLKNLEARQQESGVGLRGDISAAWDRLNEALEDARTAVNNNDPDEARSALDVAERDLDRIEKFLGR